MAESHVPDEKQSGLRIGHTERKVSRCQSLRRHVLQTNFNRQTRQAPFSPMLKEANNLQRHMSRENLVNLDSDENSTESGSSNSPKTPTVTKFLRPFARRHKTKNPTSSLKKWDRLDPQMPPSPFYTKENGNNMPVCVPVRIHKPRIYPKKVFKRTNFNLSKLTMKVSKLELKDQTQTQFPDTDNAEDYHSGPPMKKGKIDENKLQPPPAPLLQRKHYKLKVK